MFRSNAQVAAADKAASKWPVYLPHAGVEWQFVSLAPGDGAWYFAQPDRFLRVTDTEYSGGGRTFDPVPSSPAPTGWGSALEYTTQTVRQGPGCDCCSSARKGGQSRFHEGTKRWHAARHAIKALADAEAWLFRDIAVDERDEREVALLAEIRPVETAKVAKARASVESTRRLLDAEIAKDLKAHGPKPRDHAIVLASRKTVVVAVSR